MSKLYQKYEKLKENNEDLIYFSNEFLGKPHLSQRFENLVNFIPNNSFNTIASLSSAI